MNIQFKGGALKSREMILYINRNTRTTKGYFIVGEITKDKRDIHMIKIKNILSRWNIIKLSQQNL